MNDITLTYVDDEHEWTLSSYLDNYKYDNVAIDYDEVKFLSDSTYENLLELERIKRSNIIIIDSKLFKNSSVNTKLTGEEFKLIFKKIFPYTETIVITQRDSDNSEKGKGTISKYCSDNNFSFNKLSEEQYYNGVLKTHLDNAIKIILQYRAILKDAKLEKKKSQEENPIILEKVEESLKGIENYSTLNPEKIDELINIFQEVKDKLNE